MKEAPTNGRPLTTRQELFCQLHASGLPAGRAYQAAGYKGGADQADTNGSRLMGNDRVRRRVRELRRQHAASTRLTADLGPCG